MVPRSIVVQLLVLLVLVATVVVSAGSLLSYHFTAGENQRGTLKALTLDTEWRTALDSQIFIDAEHNLWQCARVLAGRLAEPAPAAPLALGQDGTVRLAPERPEAPLAGFIAHRAATLDLPRRQFTAATVLLRELGDSWCHTLPAIAIAAPNQWLATWGTAYADLSATMLPDDPILLRSEAELLAQPGNGVRWSGPYLEPATDLQCVSALLPVEIPGGGRLAIYHPVPVSNLLAKVGKDMPSGTITAILDRDMRPMACSGADGNPLPPEKGDRPGTTLPGRLAAAFAGVQVDRTGIYPAGNGDGWLAVSRLAGPGFVVVTHLPPQIVNSVAQRSALTVLIVGGLILGVLIIAITVVVDFNIARPIKALQEDIAQLAAGGQAVRPRRIRHDEIGQLGAAFDSMAHEVAQSHMSLRETLSELGQREELYRTVFAAADALLLLEDGRIIEANPRAAQLFGVDAAALIGQTLEALAPERQADEEPTRVRLQRLIQAVSDLHVAGGFHAWRARRPDGGDIDTEISIGRVSKSGGELLVVAMHDVTERNSLDMQLRQIQKMETVGQLAGGVAHDFNNLLAGMMGSAELLERRLSQDTRNQELIGRIIQAGNRAADLVRKLMSFARKGRQVSMPIDVHEVIRETCSLLERSIDRRITLHLALGAGEQLVIGDAAMLQSALLNLGVNARDAMPDGGQLEFSTRLHDLGEAEARALVPALVPGSYLEIRVRDSGTGMPPEVVKRLFEPFFTTKAVGKGTGLGLASVLRTIHDHHGHVSVSSAVGLGTTFRLLLPVVHRPETETERTRISNVPLAGHGHILVVDDDDLVRETAIEMLKSLGYTTTSARDGVAGIEAYRPGVHDLVLIDMEMPGARGIDCLRELRRRDPNVRALLCSGFARDENAAELHAAGFLGFLKKPFRLYDLSRTVAAALDQAECSGIVRLGAASGPTA